MRYARHSPLKQLALPDHLRGLRLGSLRGMLAQRLDPLGCGLTGPAELEEPPEPTTSEHKYWTRFLGRDTAFYLGPEEIARVTRFPVFFVAMRRLSRGCYEMEFELMAGAGQVEPSGTLTERYARRVEAQIHAAPSDWPWSHKRWKLKKSVYLSRT